MKFIFIADSKNSLTPFFPWWRAFTFVSVATLILLILFPKYLLIKTLRINQPSEVTLSYLQAFRQSHPQDSQLIQALVEQEIGLGQLKRAKQNMAYLKNSEKPLTSEIQNQLDWMDYLIVRYKINRTKMNTPKRISYLRQLRQMTAVLSDRPLKPQQLETIARDSLSIGQPLIALKIYNNLINENALETPEELAEGGNIAMQNNEQRDSAKFYWAAYNKSTEISGKTQYALKTIQALWAGNFVQKALLIAMKLPEPMINNRKTLLYLSRLAIAANRLDIAQNYALKSLIQSNTNMMKKLRATPYDDEAYKLLFQILTYQANIKAAFQLASIALTKKPAELEWHANVAQTATWIGDYNTSMKEWLYVVKHEKSIKTLKYAMSIAKLLGYDTVLLDMLNVYLVRKPSDTHASLELARVQNQIGQPMRALFTLKKLNTFHASRASEELTAIIYQDIGEWGKALKIWQKIDIHFGPNTQSVMAQASIYYTQGQFRKAVNVLKTGIPTADANNKEFWETLGELAWIINDRTLAILSYSHNLNDSSNLLLLVDLEKLTQPLQAIKYSLKGWALFHNPLFFFNALNLAEPLNQLQTVRHLLVGLTNEQLNIVEQSQVFWQALAKQCAIFGTESSQRQVLVEGIKQLPESHQLKSDLLWLVITSGEAVNMKTLMNEWYEQHLLNDSTLWHAFAEGFGALNQLYLAISIFQDHLPANIHNEQVIIDYASLLEKALLYQQAYDIRHYLWQKLLLQLDQQTPLNSETQQTITQLSSYFVSGTEQFQLMNALMQHRDDQNLNIVLNWLIQNNYFDFVAYLKAYYINHELPDRINIFLALAKNDLPTLQKIMEQTKKTLPRADHINAAVRLENTRMAEELAFAELTERPLANEIYSEFIQYALSDANNVNLLQEYEQFIDLTGPRTKFETKLRLTNAWKINPYINIWDLKTNNPKLITNVPAEDFQTGIKLEQKIHRGNVIYSLGYRKALNGFMPVDIDLNYKLTSRWQVNVNIGYNQEVQQTPYLRIGGTQDQLGSSLFYNIAKYDSLQAELQGFNYYSQNRHYLANGYYLHGLYEHKFWSTYPDYTIGLFGNLYHFNVNGSFGGDITTLFPTLPPQQQSDPALVKSTQTADYNQVIPPSYQEGGFIFSFGNAILDYTHAWRPYLWASYYYNSYVGLAYDVKIGVNGTVFGRDSLLFYAERGTGQAVLNSVSQKVGIRYALYF